MSKYPILWFRDYPGVSDYIGEYPDGEEWGLMINPEKQRGWWCHSPIEESDYPRWDLAVVFSGQDVSLLEFLKEHYPEVLI